MNNFLIELINFMATLKILITNLLYSSFKHSKKIRITQHTMKKLYEALTEGAYCSVYIEGLCFSNSFLLYQSRTPPSEPRTPVSHPRRPTIHQRNPRCVNHEEPLLTNMSSVITTGVGAEMFELVMSQIVHFWTQIPSSRIVKSQRSSR